MSQRKYTVVSLFSGAMGLDIGVEQTGRFKILAAVEKEHVFCETIRVNRDARRLTNRRLKVYETDIKKLRPQKLMKDLGLKVGELDLLIGGPPCQSFSTAGRRQTVQDPRGTLIWDFLRFVAVLQPKFFLMENVRGLLSAALNHRPIKERPEKGGPPLHPDEEPGSVVRLFASDLQVIPGGSYRLDCFEVNAVNYGAPQLRERALFIGNRFNILTEFPPPTHASSSTDGNGQGDLFGLKYKPFRTLGDVIRGLREKKPVLMDFSPRKKRYLALVPPGGNWRCLPEELQRESMGSAWHAKGGRSGWWRKLSYDLPCPTIVTMPNHAGTSLCHPEEVRVLSLRECALLQEFPRGWGFIGTPAEQYAQVGNAVPVRLGLVAGSLIAQHLDALPGVRRGREKHRQVLPHFRVVYVRSHVRTRQWYKDGHALVWRDGDKNHKARHREPKTHRAVRIVQ